MNEQKANKMASIPMKKLFWKIGETYGIKVSYKQR